MNISIIYHNLNIWWDLVTNYLTLFNFLSHIEILEENMGLSEGFSSKWWPFRFLKMKRKSFAI